MWRWVRKRRGASPAEPVVVMRRYPESSRLSTLVRRGAPVEPELAKIAEVVARFHDDADRGRHIDAQAKARYRCPPGINRGYTPPKAESLANSLGLASAADLFEAL